MRANKRRACPENVVVISLHNGIRKKQGFILPRITPRITRRTGAVSNPVHVYSIYGLGNDIKIITVGGILVFPLDRTNP